MNRFPSVQEDERVEVVLDARVVSLGEEGEIVGAVGGGFFGVELVVELSLPPTMIWRASGRIWLVAYHLRWVRPLGISRQSQELSEQGL